MLLMEFIQQEMIWKVETTHDVIKLGDLGEYRARKIAQSVENATICNNTCEKTQ